MSRKGGDETVSVSASFRCSLMGECDTDLEFCLSKDSSGAPKVGIDHRRKVQGEFESRVRAMKSFTRHSRDSGATLVLQHGDISLVGDEGNSDHFRENGWSLEPQRPGPCEI